MATGRRQRTSFSQNQEGILGYNGTIKFNKIEERSSQKKHISNIKYETFSMNFTEFGQDMVDSLRKGWDGSIKGGKRNLDANIELISPDGKSQGRINFKLKDQAGKLESCNSSNLCGKTDHL